MDQTPERSRKLREMRWWTRAFGPLVAGTLLAVAGAMAAQRFLRRRRPWYERLGERVPHGRVHLPQRLTHR